jgi:hypothetical protein
MQRVGSKPCGERGGALDVYKVSASFVIEARSAASDLCLAGGRAYNAQLLKALYEKSAETE